MVGCVEQAIDILSPMIFESHQTITEPILQSMHPEWSADLTKRMLFAIAQKLSAKVSVKYLAVGESMNDPGVIKIGLYSSLEAVEDDLTTVQSVSVFSVAVNGSAEPDMEIVSRSAAGVRAAILAHKDGIWRAPWAGAWSSECPVRDVRVFLPPQAVLKGPTTTALKPAITPKPSVIAKPKETLQFKTAPKPETKREPPMVKSPAHNEVISVKSSQSASKHDDEDELSFRKTKKAKALKSSGIADDDDAAVNQLNTLQAETISSENSSDIMNAQEPIFETQEVEYKQRKKVTVTEISISSDGYMEVEDKEVMQEQVLKETVTRQVNKPASRLPVSKANAKSAPAGQRSLTDMFRAK